MAFSENSDPIKDMDIGIIDITNLPIEKIFKIWDMISKGDTSRLMYKGEFFDTLSKEKQEGIRFKLTVELYYYSTFSYSINTK